MSYEGYRAHRVVELPKGSTGAVIEVTVTEDGAAVGDISAATSILFNTKTIDGVAIDSDVVAAFTNTGADSKLDLPVSAATVGTVRELIADYRYTLGGENFVSFPFVIRIVDGAK